MRPIQGPMPILLHPVQGPADDIMAGRQSGSAQIAGGGQQIAEFHRPIAIHAGNGGFPSKIGVNKAINHRITETAFVIKDIMGDIQLFGDPARIMDVLSGTAGPCAMHRLAMIV